jgi:hypothetical protein
MVKLTKSNLITALFTLLALGFICYSRGGSDESTFNSNKSTFLFSRSSAWQRILATVNYLTSIGNYAITDADRAIKHCKDMDIRGRSKNIGVSAQADLDKFFSLGRSNIKTWLSTGDNGALVDYGVANIPVYAVSVLSLVFSIICFIYL